MATRATKSAVRATTTATKTARAAKKTPVAARRTTSAQVNGQANGWVPAPMADPDYGYEGPAPWSPLTAGEELTAAADPTMRFRPFDLVEHLHRARYAMVRRLLWLLAAVLAGGIGMLVSVRWTGLAPDDVSDFVTMIFGATVALTGCAVGFCFGSSVRRE